jgi:hypothetical protein
MSKYYLGFEKKIEALTFIAKKENSTVKIERKGDLPSFENLFYRTSVNDSYTDWKKYNSAFSEIIELKNIGDKIQFWNKSEKFSLSIKQYASFRFSGEVESSGNIMSLMNFAEECYDYCFAFVFYTAGDGLLSAPKFPATKLAEGCYYGAFQGCTKLIETPKLPAIKLETKCYMFMFAGCTSLISASNIITNEIPLGACRQMFDGCTNLQKAPKIQYIKNIEESGCRAMFNNCTSLSSGIGTAKINTIGYAGCYQMFYNCYNLETEIPISLAENIDAFACGYMFFNNYKLTKAPELPAIQLTASCYNQMFANCSGLTDTPILSAENPVAGCYNAMFNGCSKLNNVTINLSSWIENVSGTIVTNNWLSGVAETGTFTSLNTELDTNSKSPSTVPEGWTINK